MEKMDGHTQDADNSAGHLPLSHIGVLGSDSTQRILRDSIYSNTCC